MSEYNYSVQMRIDDNRCYHAQVIAHSMVEAIAAAMIQIRENQPDKTIPLNAGDTNISFCIKRCNNMF